MLTSQLQNDYYPFGMLQPGRNHNTPSYRFGFNGKENDNEVKGAGNQQDYDSRIYDPRLGKWLSVDPLTKKFPWQGPYNSMSDDPINRIDPDGRGDFYSQAGKKLGSDGNDDGKLYVVTDKATTKLIKKNTKNNIFTQVKEVQESIVQLPSAYVRTEIGKAVDRSNSPTPDDKKGGFHEEGGIFGTNSDGVEKVIHASSGPAANPKTDNHAEVDIFKAANSSEQGSITNVSGTFHVHPSGTTTENSTDNNSSPGSVTFGGTTTTYSFVQPPSNVDVSNANQGGNVSGYNIVVGARDNTVYLHGNNSQNQAGQNYQATFPLDKFRSIGIASPATEKK
jgi:RHS repeat-associated protein